ncbi:thioredoxin family protein [Candidatus Peregrinibacteria bacterium]|nr:MAG: thioredoxin family protein [Candidatus Peregrinibacteria bacterium]
MTKKLTFNFQVLATLALLLVSLTLLSGCKVPVDTDDSMMNSDETMMNSDETMMEGDETMMEGDEWSMDGEDAMMKKDSEVMENQSDDAMMKKDESMMEGDSMEKSADDVMSYVSGMTQPYQLAAYNQAVQDGKTVLLDFYANWCPICRANAPSLKSAAGQTDAIVFTVDYDNEAALKKQLGVTSQSTYVLLKDGNEVARISGAQSEAEFVAF